MTKIYIKENQVSLLINEEQKEEVTFYEFVINVKQFLKDLLKKPIEAKPSDLLTKAGLTKDELLKKMKDIGMIKSEERIDEVPVEESTKHPYGTKLVAKHYVSYKIPRKRFKEKMQELYKDCISECNTKQVFSDTKQIINDVLDMDGETYKKRGGYDESLVSETDCGGVMQGGGGNPSAGQYDVPLSSPQRRGFWKPALKRNKDEKNKSISMNRE